MNNQQHKGIEELKSISMTEREKSLMLSNIFSKPIESPYKKYIRVFAFAYSNSLRVALSVVLIFSLSFSGVAYASNFSLPGDVLYPIKTRVVEPILDVVNSSPEKKIVWTEEKVARRIEEAKNLAKEDKLDDKKVEELEKKIEHSSKEFKNAVQVVLEKSATSTKDFEKDREEREEKFKQDFKEKISNSNDKEKLESKNVEKKEEKQYKSKDSEESSKKVERLKDKAIKTIETKDRSKNKKDK